MMMNRCFRGKQLFSFHKALIYIYTFHKINIQSIRKITLCLIIRCLPSNQIPPWDQRMLISSLLVVTTVKHRDIIRNSLLSLLKQSNNLDNSLSNLINNNILIIILYPPLPQSPSPSPPSSL